MHSKHLDMYILTKTMLDGYKDTYMQYSYAKDLEAHDYDEAAKRCLNRALERIKMFDEDMAQYEALCEKRQKEKMAKMSEEEKEMYEDFIEDHEHSCSHNEIKHQMAEMKMKIDKMKASL